MELFLFIMTIYFEEKSSSSSLKKNKIVINKGFDIKIKSQIFINAGISSSSMVIFSLVTLVESSSAVMISQ